MVSLTAPVTMRHLTIQLESCTAMIPDVGFYCWEQLTTLENICEKEV